VGEERDETLAMRAAQGCRASFALLLDRHYDRIYRLAWRWTGSRTAGEDIAQDVAVKLARAIRAFRGDAAFTTWLHRIAYTTTVDFLRANQRSVSVDPSEIVRLIDSVAEVRPDAETVGVDFWTAVRSLPDQQRDAVLLVYGEDLSHAEAATVMGCSENTVSWHVHEARKRLKILFEAVS
jgi:RNA polymerase sigma-70 factor (ECF subfamily)